MSYYTNTYLCTWSVLTHYSIACRYTTSVYKWSLIYNTLLLCRYSTVLRPMLVTTHGRLLLASCPLPWGKSWQKSIPYSEIIIFFMSSLSSLLSVISLLFLLNAACYVSVVNLSSTSSSHYYYHLGKILFGLFEACPPVVGVATLAVS